MLNIALTLEGFQRRNALKAFRGKGFRALGGSYLPLAYVTIIQPLQ